VEHTKKISLKSIFLACLTILPRRSKVKILRMTIFQILSSILDLAGVLLFGLISTLLIQKFSGAKIPMNGMLMKIMSPFGLENLSVNGKIAVFGALIVALFSIRTLLTIFLTKRILIELSKQAADLSVKLIESMLSKSILDIQKVPRQQTIFSVTKGVDQILIQIVGTLTVVVADLSLLLTLSIGLFFIDLRTASFALFGFLSMGFGLYHFMRNKAQFLGSLSSKINIEANTVITEILESYREVLVWNRKTFFVDQVKQLRLKLSRINADLSLMPYVSKYVMEGSLILGGAILVGFQTIFGDTSSTVTSVTIFLAAGSRIAPTILRIQQSFVQIRSSIGIAGPTLVLINGLDFGSEQDIEPFPVQNARSFESSISLDSVSFTYPDRTDRAITDFSLSIQPGEFVALVGPSGGGKSTILDLALGIIHPSEGNIQISGVSPREAFKLWPSSVSYIPQNVHIANRSIKDNILLGISSDSMLDEVVQGVIDQAALREYILNLPNGIETVVGENGWGVSGGEQQRIGFARALLHRPKVILMDEATSSLDALTEETITKSLSALYGNTTILVVAHRLSTVRNADLVVYMDGGEILAKGKFDEVRRAVPEFDNQAKLMGL